MYAYHIYSRLKKQSRFNKSFHVPGHKAHGDFKNKFTIAPLDITELSYSDNLACPDGIIADAQKDIAEILGAQKSYIVTDGSSSGVLSMIYAVKGRGTKIIVPRNCHQSVWNACKIFNLEPVIVQGENEDGLMTPPAPELIRELIENDITIGAMIVTSPDYYGRVAPLKEYSEILKKNKRLLIVDGAHGSHLAFEQNRRGYAGVYADLWVDGAHKSLPVLTQGAVVSVNNKELIPALEEGLNIFRTTSPSYPIMASVEYGIKFVKNNEKVLTDTIEAVKAFREKCVLPVLPTDDWTKIVVDFSAKGICADKAAKRLEKKGFYAELSDGRYIIFYVSVMTTLAELNSLNNAISSVVSNKKLKGTYIERPSIPKNDRTFSFQYALKRKRELIPFKNAVGRMCAEGAGITPPCIPVIVAGEMITKEVIEVLSAAKATFGVVDGKIWVVKR
ncbi:MAG: aminotransferase class I/II-fold pyridoxal phosphate-dependent enzyme [Clostridiales bacterium]|nr:aminotransferase class I/II-fold pyridoxal phosphate-dependent enzyme [Clostridiales bacterium]